MVSSPWLVWAALGSATVKRTSLGLLGKPIRTELRWKLRERRMYERCARRLLEVN